MNNFSSSIASRFLYENRAGKKIEGLYLGNIFSDYDNYINIKSNAIDNNIHSKVRKSVESSINHEVGHFLTDLTNLDNDRKLNALYNYLKGHNLISSYVSRYADEFSGIKGFREFIAECFAEYTSSDNPRKIAKIVGKKIDREYTKL